MRQRRIKARVCNKGEACAVGTEVLVMQKHPRHDRVNGGSRGRFGRFPSLFLQNAEDFFKCPRGQGGLPTFYLMENITSGRAAYLGNKIIVPVAVYTDVC